MNGDTGPSGIELQSENDFSIFPAVKVINLERSAERWTSISQSLESAGINNFSRINAVDARTLSQDQIDDAYDSDANRRYYFAPLMPGEIACFLSHRKAWRAIIEENLDGACILEDDVLVKPGLVRSLRDIADYAKSSQAIVIKVFSKRLALGKATHVSEQTRLVEQILPPIGTHGAYINNAAAEKLLIHSKKFYEPVDVYLQRTWTHGVNIQVLVPNALDEVSAQLGGTTLNLGKTKNSSRFRREVMRPVFRISMFMRAFWARAVRR